MSASLVGSEMCIRDSWGAGTAPDPPLHPSRAWLPRPPTGAEALIWGQEAVSYTHLTLPTICSV
eukprot:8648900-Alexandrium_andersonii.AAC.1